MCARIVEAIRFSPALKEEYEWPERAIQVTVMFEKFGITEAKEFVAVDVNFDIRVTIAAFYWFATEGD